MEFALEKELMMIGRLLIAGLCGGVIGHERENRRKPAGVRTHTVVGVASALMMLISKYGFNDVLNEYTKLDPSRVAAGVVTAIGFLGSGMIIARNKSVSGITTSAGIWATVGVGLAVGSGMIYLGIATSVIGRYHGAAPGGDVCGERGDLRWTEGASRIEGVYRGNGISYPQHRIFPKGKGNRQGKHYPWCSKTEEYCGAVHPST